MTMAEDKYVGPLTISIQQALKYYPDSQYVVYDAGISSENRAKLKQISPNVQLVSWTVRYVPLEVHHSAAFVVRKTCGIVWNELKRVFIKNKINQSFQSLYNQREFEIKILNKLLCIQDCNERYKSRFIFLDADAFLINRVDEIIDEPDIDLAVTQRRNQELAYTYNACRLLNTGVIFFLGDYDTNKTVINAWHDEALHHTHEAIAEQTALSRLLHKKKDNFFNHLNTNQELRFGDTPVTVRTLPCELYNYNWIEEFYSDRDRDTVKILHLKSGRFNTPMFKKIARTLSITL